jgi:hypothetical protein
MEGADGTPVQDDLDERVAAANATHTDMTNDDFGDLTAPYEGGMVVLSENPLYHDDEVLAALAGDDLFETGGFTGSDYTVNSPYVDMLWLAQASKATGEKLF